MAKVRRRERRGLSLIELVGLLAILAFIAIMAIPHQARTGTDRPQTTEQAQPAPAQPSAGTPQAFDAF